MIKYGTKPGTLVRLETLPDGYLSQYSDLTLGKDYLLKEFFGSCIVITTNNPADDAHVWRGRANVSSFNPK